VPRVNPGSTFLGNQGLQNNQVLRPAGRKGVEMKKLTFALSAATALAAATIGLAAPAAAPSGAGLAHDTVSLCTVHVFHQGSVVDVRWC
jgi:hypothetical protein